MKLIIQTQQKRQLIDITDDINERLKATDTNYSLSVIVVKHTTCAISTADLDPGGTDLDYMDFFTAITPQLRYRHPHNPAHVPDHILASIVGPSLSLPVKKQQLVLGMWQRVVLIEFDGPRQRQIEITLL